MKPKVALVKDGFLPPGSENKRGRLSRAAIERLEQLAASGVKIDGYNVSQTSDPDVPMVEKTRDPNAIAELPPELHPESEYRAFTGTVERGMRTVCNCHTASLIYCPSESPRIWVDFDREGVVVFRQRKG